MLPLRSVYVVQVILVICLLVSFSTGQDYDAVEDEETDRADLNEDDDRPDYSKHYAKEKSSPIAEGGFVPSDGFFGQFSNGFEQNQQQKPNTFVQKNPFNQKQATSFQNLQGDFPEFYNSAPFNKDFFEESQKEQVNEEAEADDEENENLEEDEGDQSDYPSNPGPSYITRQLPSENHDYRDEESYSKPSYQTTEPYTPIKGNKLLKFPKAPGLRPGKKYNKLTPYQKYSFKPDRYTSGPTTPYNPNYQKRTPKPDTLFTAAESNPIPKHLQGKKCTKTKNHEGMDCYVCLNPKTHSKFTECAYYNREPSTDNRSSKRYSLPKQRDSSRYKRFARQKNDPYEIIKSQSSSLYDNDEEYNFEPIPDFHLDKSESEVESEKVAKNPANCQTVQRNGLTCKVCKDPESDGNFEQCSFSVQNEPKKYAYVSEKTYDHFQEPHDEEQHEEPKNVDAKHDKKHDHDHDNDDSIEKQDDYRYDSDEEAKPKRKNSKPSRRYKGKEPKRDGRRNEESNYNPFTEDQKERRDKHHELDEAPYEIPDFFSESKDAKTVEKPTPKAAVESEEDFYLKYFPEFTNEESQLDTVQIPYLESAESSTESDVEKVLAEFATKNRTNCQKSEKNGMTCYSCVDANGAKNEECMYVSDTKPQSSHVNYRGTIQHRGDVPLETLKEELLKEQVENTTTKETSDVLSEEQTDLTPKLIKLTTTSENPSLFDGQDLTRKIWSRTKPTKRISSKYGSTTLPPYDFYTSPKPAKFQYTKRPSRKPLTYKRKNKKYGVTLPTATETIAAAESALDAERIDVGDENEKYVEPETPKEFDVAEEDGAFSAETKPVYSKSQGTNLPKYMVEKSDFEKEFDDFVASLHNE